MTLDLSDVVLDLADSTVTVTRTAAASPPFVAGVAQAGATSTFTAQASVQPATGRDLLRLEEGFRTRDVRAVFTPTALRTASVDGQTAADVVTLPDGDFEVQHVEPWPGGFVKCLVSRIQH